MAESTQAKGTPLWAWPGLVVGAIYRGLTRDGAIGASLNQARDELKEATRAFPDSIHVQPVSIAGQAEEAVTVHGPNENKAAAKAVSTPQGKGEAAAATVHGPTDSKTAGKAADPSHGQSNGAAEERLPSASEIARGHTTAAEGHTSSDGADAADEHLPSASEIARDDTPYLPEQAQQQELSNSRGRSR